MHTDVTDWHATAQPRDEARQHFADHHDYGYAPELGDARCFDRTQPERARRAEHWRAEHRNRYHQGEDALTG